MAGTPRTRFASLIASLLALALPNAAGAATNSVALSGKLAMATMPSATAPANTGFEWAHHITTLPGGNQPDTADSFKVLFSSPLILNAQDFPACPAASADGQQTLSADCQNAVVGSGSATMYAGSPGSPLSNSVREDVTVKVLNGAPAGSALLLVLSSVPSAPVVFTNRVLPGTITPAEGYAFAAEFAVPHDLQNQLGLSIVISDLDVTISGTPRPITVGSTTSSISYLQLPSCGEALVARQLTNFRAAGAITSDASIACAMGAFPDPPGYPTAPYTSPRAPVYADPAPVQVPAFTLAKGSTNLGRVRARRNGRVALPGVTVLCPTNASGPCPVSGRATRGRTVVAKLGLRLAAGAHTSLALKLARAGKRLLARRKSLPLTVVLKASTPAGATATKTLRLTLTR